VHLCRITTHCFLLLGLLNGTNAFAQSQKRGSHKGRAPAVHPAITNAQQCADCHGVEFEQWKTSKHGQGLVKCLVCHGAVDSNFIPKPGAGRCLACHGEMVRNLNTAAPTKGKTCFSCHSPHSLDPHARPAGGQQ